MQSASSGRSGYGSEPPPSNLNCSIWSALTDNNQRHKLTFESKCWNECKCTDVRTFQPGLITGWGPFSDRIGLWHCVCVCSYTIVMIYEQTNKQYVVKSVNRREEEVFWGFGFVCFHLHRHTLTHSGFLFYFYLSLYMYILYVYVCMCIFVEKRQPVGFSL